MLFECFIFVFLDDVFSWVCIFIKPVPYFIIGNFFKLFFMFSQEVRLQTSVTILGFLINNKRYDGVMIDDVAIEAVGYTDALLNELRRTSSQVVHTN